MKKARFTALLLTAVMLFTCCGTKEFEQPFDVNTPKSAFRFEPNNADHTAASFASELAVISGDVIPPESGLSGSESFASAILIDVGRHSPVFSRNATARLYPASMTKVLTALVAFENGNSDQILTADEDCVLVASDVQKIGLKPGDTMTLDQALHILLIYSANDVAILIAKNIGGSVEGFAEMMNKRAASLGATNSNFVNPHGLHDENHYATAYDMYLIFNQATRIEDFNQIISMQTYATTYRNAVGEDVTVSIENTNRLLKSPPAAASNVTVVGGKTGTTLAAGACLVLLSRDAKGDSYISCIMKGTNTSIMYEDMKTLLSDINGL